MFDKVKVFVEENKEVVTKVAIVAACGVAGAVIFAKFYNGEEDEFLPPEDVEEIEEASAE